MQDKRRGARGVRGVQNLKLPLSPRVRSEINTRPRQVARCDIKAGEGTNETFGAGGYDGPTDAKNEELVLVAEGFRRGRDRVNVAWTDICQGTLWRLPTVVDIISVGSYHNTYNTLPTSYQD